MKIEKNLTYFEDAKARCDAQDARSNRPGRNKKFYYKRNKIIGPGINKRSG